MQSRRGGGDTSPSTGKSGAAFSKDLLQTLHDDVELFTSPRGSQPPQYATAASKLPQFRTEEQIATAWAHQQRERDTQSQLLAVREKLQNLLLEKDAWVMKDLRQQESHNESLRIMDEQMSELRRSLSQAQSRLVSLESELTASQRRVFEEEQRVVQLERDGELAMQESQQTHQCNIQRIKDLTATVGSLRESLTDQTNRQEEAVRNARESAAQLADLKDEIETLRAARASLNHRTGTLDAENESLREKVASLERQLQLATVEQRAQSDELHVVRDREVPRLTKALSDSQRDVTELRESLAEERKRCEVAMSSQTERAILQERLSHVQSQLAEALEDAKGLREISEELRMEVRRLSRANESLDAEVVHNRQSNELLAKELQAQRDDIKATMEAAKHAQEEQSRKYRDAVAQLEGQAHSLRQQLSEAQDRTQRTARDHDMELHAAYASLEEQKGVAAQLRTMLEEQAHALERAQSQLAAQKDFVPPDRVAELRSRLEDQLAQYATSSEGHQRNAHQMRLANDTIRHEVEELKRKLQAAASREDSLRRLLVDAEVALGLRNPNAVMLQESLEVSSLPPMTDLSGSIRSLLRDRNEALEKAEKATAECQRLSMSSQQEISALRDEGRMFADQAAKAHQQLTDMERETKRAQSQFEGRLAELATEKRCAELRDQEAKISVEATHQREVERLTAQIEKAKALHLESEEAALKLRTQLADAQVNAQRGEKESGGLQRKLDEAALRERHLTERVRTLESDLVKAKAREEELLTSLDDAASAALQTRRDTEKAAVALTDALTKEQHDMTLERQALQQQLAHLERELQRQTQHFELEAEVARTAEERCAELEKVVAECRKDRDELFQTLEGIKATSRSAAAAQEANTHTMEGELTAIRERLLATQSEIHAISRERDALLIENGKLSGERTEALNRLEVLLQQQQQQQKRVETAATPPPAPATPPPPVGRRGSVVGSATLSSVGSSSGPTFPSHTTVQFTDLHTPHNNATQSNASVYRQVSPSATTATATAPSNIIYHHQQQRDVPNKADALPMRGPVMAGSAASASPTTGSNSNTIHGSGSVGFFAPTTPPAAVGPHHHHLPSMMMMHATSTDAIRERNDALLQQLRAQRMTLTGGGTSF